MAIERRQVLIVHGWSDSYQSFQPLKSLLVAAGYETTQVFLGNYASMRDDVTFDDLATGLQQRFVEMIKDGELLTNGASSLYRAGAGLALAILIGLDDTGAHVLQAVLFAIGVFVMATFIRAAQRVEPFTRRA